VDSHTVNPSRFGFAEAARRRLPGGPGKPLGTGGLA
jgi:hypothetical protein